MMTSAKTRAYKMLLNRITVDGQLRFIARQASLRLQGATGSKNEKGTLQPQTFGPLMEVHIDERVLVSPGVANVCQIVM